MDSTARENVRYTAAQYYEAVGDSEELTELDDGYIIVLGNPNISHQRISRRITTTFDNYILAHGGNCEPFSAPTEAELDESNVVIPDVFISCHPENFDNDRYYGAPDLVIEIVSKNRKRDFIDKLFKYRKAGVREYWIVDPKYRETVVYFFEEDILAKKYPFDESIPVRIYGGMPDPLTINIAELIAPFVTEVQE